MHESLTVSVSRYELAELCGRLSLAVLQDPPDLADIKAVRDRIAVLVKRGSDAGHPASP